MANKLPNAYELAIKPDTVQWSTLLPLDGVSLYGYVDLAPILTVHDRDGNEARNLGEVELHAYGNVDTNEAATFLAIVSGRCPCYNATREATRFEFSPADVVEAGDYYLHVYVDDLTPYTDLYETSDNVYIDGPPLEMV